MFIVATNYEDRIDAAIKRSGRIDHKFLVLPPDKDCRRKILEQLLKKELKNNILSEVRNNWKEFDKTSLFYGFTDIKAAVNHADVTTLGSLIDQLAKRARTISLKAYSSRFIGRENKPLNAKKIPMDEFLCLIALFLQVHNPDELKSIIPKIFLNILTEDTQLNKINKDLIQEHAPQLDADNAGYVADALNAISSKDGF